MNLDLTGKTAMVCGSTQGIGKATAIELATLGANVVLVARNEESLRVTLKELDDSKGQKHNFLCADFQQSNQLKEKLEHRHLLSFRLMPQNGKVLNGQRKRVYILLFLPLIMKWIWQ